MTAQAPRSGARRLARGTRFLRTPGIETHQESHPGRVRGVRDTLLGCGFQSCQSIPGVRKKRVPLFDLKDSKSQIDLNEKDKKIVLQSVDDFKLKAVVEVLQQKLAKRKVPLKNFSYGPIIPAAGSTVRQEITVQSGIPIEKSREIVKKIKDSKIKVQASIQGDFVRVSGKSRDLLQEVIQLLRASDFGLELQFTNYRTF
ncbi:MAG: YajQ family cyclic di-GMP-binding protein [Acidobacteria bacterium]|nr:MAG: YajQ family cyclic di-GMP-binding protein [Acidobacteriota bacterium]